MTSSAPVPGVRCPNEGCGGTIPHGRTRCPSCHKYSFAATTVEGDEETVLLSDARLSEVKRIPTGMLDSVLGGGLVCTSVNLIAGPPGAGKTTLFLQLCDVLAEHALACGSNKEVLYIANEQEAAEIKTTAKRIEVKHLNKIRIVRAMGGLRRDLGSMLLEYKPCGIILDSLTKLCGDDPNLAVQVVERLKGYTVELQAPSLIVNQINKDGDHAGLQKVQHAADALFMLDKDDTDGARFFYSTKNRFGQAPKGVSLEMTSEDAPIPGKLIVKLDEEDEEGQEDNE